MLPKIYCTTKIIQPLKTYWIANGANRDGQNRSNSIAGEKTNPLELKTCWTSAQKSRYHSLERFLLTNHTHFLGLGACTLSSFVTYCADRIHAMTNFSWKSIWIESWLEWIQRRIQKITLESAMRLNNVFERQCLTTKQPKTSIVTWTPELNE